MSRFIEWLVKLNLSDTKVKAVLRRSLSFEPGGYVPAYPYVEPFMKSDDNYWRREMHYLVAGLWAGHWREGRTGETMPIGKACAKHQNSSGSSSTERRFISLLDADHDQLPQRLRQMIALLKEYSIDFDELLKGLLRWDYDRKPTQNEWARDFYRNLKQESDIENNTVKELVE